MNKLLVFLYTVVFILSEIMLYIPVKFIKEKAYDRQRLIDFVQIDVAICTGLYIGYHSSLAIVREFVGPFYDEQLVDIVLFFVLWLLYLMMASIVSLQIFQFASILFTSTVNEISENILLTLHRCFIFTVSLTLASIICYNKAGVCWKGPLHMYILQDTIKAVPFKSTVAANIPAYGFFFTIIFCQVGVETKRFLVGLEEHKAEARARGAVSQIEEALYKMKKSLSSHQVNNMKKKRFLPAADST